MSYPDPTAAKGAMTRIREALDNERRYYDALRDAGIGIVEVAERLQSADADREAASLDLLDIAQRILVAMRLSLPEDTGDAP